MTQTSSQKRFAILGLLVVGLGVAFILGRPTGTPPGPVGVEESPEGQETGRLEDILLGKSKEEKATLKSERIAKLPLAGKTVERVKYNVEVRSLSAIEGGVEVYARVWDKSGHQKAFGADGSVEIERFRIFNPPVLVADPAGDIVRVSEDEIRGTFERRFREDPEEAFLSALEDTVALVAKSDEHVVRGKVGHTTDTFYSDTGDTRTGTDLSSWALAHDAGSGGYVDPTSNNQFYVQAEKQTNYNVDVPFIMFDTSAIPAANTITAAVFSLYDLNSSEDTDPVGVLQSTQTTWNSIVAGDFSKRGTTEGATRLSAFSASAYNDWTFNATGIGFIARNGETKPASASASGKTQLVIRMARDIDNSAPSARSYRQYSSADATGTTQDPKLVVTHSAPPAPVGGDQLIIFE